MSVYIPPSFAAGKSAAITRLMHDYPFATLITPGTPEPWVSHLPLLFTATPEPNGSLIGHFARANPHWRHAGVVPSMAVFHGPHAYVSPSWYAEPALAVPTWNFTAVHVHGTLEIQDDAVTARGVLDALVERFEGERVSPWKFAMPERQRDAMVGAIVAFRIPIARVDAKLKLSQNRPRDDRKRVIAALNGEGYAEATATAAWMQQYANPDDEPR